MTFINYIKEKNPDLLEKLSGVEKSPLINLFEKQAEYIIKALMEKKAEEEVKEIKSGTDYKQPTEDPNVSPELAPIPVTEAITGGQNNKNMDDNRPSPSIKVNDLKDAVQEALVAGAGDKVITFVKALAEQNPEAINEVIKIIKVELHSAYMNKIIDEESALKVSNELNLLLDGEK
jgi:hypothetical protein